MPLLMDDTMEKVNTENNYQFSATRLDHLGASEYSLVTIVCDISSSVYYFQNDLMECLKTILDSCQKNPRSENLLLRLVSFNKHVNEIHGFKLLGDIDKLDYNGCISAGGTTALYDAVYKSVDATNDYAKILTEQDYLTNAIIFVLTDGMDNESTETPNRIKNKLAGVFQEENLESVNIVLIGVNVNDSSVKSYLDEFKKEADINQYINIDEASASSLAKLAQWISQSISSTSKALGTGDSSQLLSF